MRKQLAAALAVTVLAGLTAAASGGLPARASISDQVALDVSAGISDRANLAAEGLLPVTIRTTEDVDATALDLDALVAEGGVEPARNSDGTVITTVTDTDGDGRSDVIVQFDIGALREAGALTPDSEQLTISTRSADGRAAAGSADIEPYVELEIKFAEDVAARDGDAALQTQSRGLERAAETIERAGGELRPLAPESAVDDIQQQTAEVEARSAEDVPDMASWYRLTLPADADGQRLAADLSSLADVEHAYPAPTPVPPPQRTETPDFTDLQGYLKAAPQGINADFSRQDDRVRGEGIKIVDLEYDWNPFHEDLQLDWSTDLGGDVFPRYSGFGDEHGTAVFGELVALDNGYGVTGGVPDAEIYGISPTERRPWGGTSWNPGAALAYLASLDLLEPGDVVLLEQQTVGPNGDYAPLEWIPSVFDANELLTSMGVTVVSTGGNGDEDVDGPNYTRDGIDWFDPDVQHSGSIMVGAGGSGESWTGARERLGFSNYGERFDLQAWGEDIATTGYCSLYCDPDDHNVRYSQTFGGTSGAGPIVTSAVAAVQSYVTATGQEPWSADEISELLKQTGTPQGPETADDEHIGPMPDLKVALRTIEVDAPETAATLDSRQAGQGAHCTQVTLEADDDWGSGVDRTEFRVDDREWATYDGPFRVGGVFERTLEFRSVDHNGNVEEPRELSLGDDPGGAHGPGEPIDAHCR